MIPHSAGNTAVTPRACMPTHAFVILELVHIGVHGIFAPVPNFHIRDGDAFRVAHGTMFGARKTAVVKRGQLPVGKNVVAVSVDAVKQVLEFVLRELGCIDLQDGSHRLRKYTTREWARRSIQKRRIGWIIKPHSTVLARMRLLIVGAPCRTPR